MAGARDDAQAGRRAGAGARRPRRGGGAGGPERRGLAAAPKDAGIQHLLYQSVGSAHRRTGIPHFDNKWRVEQTIEGLSFPSWTVLRPVFFMENLLSPWFKPYIDQGTLAIGMKPETRLQTIAVRDIFYSVPIEQVRSGSEEYAVMLEWFDAVGYDVDIERTATEFGVRPPASGSGRPNSSGAEAAPEEPGGKWSS